MKPIITKEKLPKFLVVNATKTKEPYNRFLNKPYEVGEIVKVAPFEEQVPHPDIDSTPSWFRKRYVKIVRKDADGRWTLNYVASWDTFDLLTKTK